MTGPAAPARFGRTTLPQEQHDMLQRAKRIQYGGLAYMTTVIVLVYLVMGSSQAMKAETTSIRRSVTTRIQAFTAGLNVSVSSDTKAWPRVICAQGRNAKTAKPIPIEISS